MMIENAMNEGKYFFLGRLKWKRTKGAQLWVELRDGVGELRTLSKVYVYGHHTYVPYVVEAWEVVGNGGLVMELRGIREGSDLPSEEFFMVKGGEVTEGGEEWEKWIGYEVYDEEGFLLGCVQEVIPRMMQPLLEIDHGGSRVLIPLHKQFVIGIDGDAKRLEVRLPTGYLDVFRGT